MSSSNSRQWTSAGLVAILLLVIVGCGSGSDQRQPSVTKPEPASPATLFPHWPSELDEFRFHWSASPGIDLATSPAVALRAYLESFRVVGLTGGDFTAAYPGFDRATPENESKQLTDATAQLQMTGVRPRSRAEAEQNGWKYVRRDYYGYEPVHILALESLGSGYRATVCDGTYARYAAVDKDKTNYVPIVADSKTGNLAYGDWELIDVWRIELTENDSRTQSSGVSPSAPQVGPLPAPTDDVFGRWFITGASTGLWGPIGSAEKVDTPEVRQQCENAMPDDAATRKAMGTGFHDAPPPHGDPIPGWPQASG